MKLRTVLETARGHANEIAAGVALTLAVVFGLSAIVRFQAEPDAAPVAAVAAAIAAPDAAPTVAALVPTPALLRAPEPQLSVIEGELGRHQTLGHALQKQGLDGALVDEIVDAMSPVFNFRYARVGDDYRASLTPAGELVGFDYIRSPIVSYSLKREGGKLVARKHEPNVMVQRALLAGVVTSNLYQSVVDLGETGELAHDFAEIRRRPVL